MGTDLLLEQQTLAMLVQSPCKTETHMISPHTIASVGASRKSAASVVRSKPVRLTTSVTVLVRLDANSATTVDSVAFDCELARTVGVQRVE